MILKDFRIHDRLLDGVQPKHHLIVHFVCLHHDLDYPFYDLVLD